jgi:intracellular multiplication protein IcmE
MKHEAGGSEEKTNAANGAAAAKTAEANALGGGAAGKGPAKPPLVKAGTIAYAVLDTAVDSDYPDTPIMATIVQGSLKGAKLLGKMNLATGKDKVSLTFTQMDKDDWINVKKVSAFAVDPDTARTVMASNVDYHYLKRYGAIMAASFLSGYSSAITQAGTSTTGIFGTSSVHNALSPGNKIAVGLGQIGTNLTTIAQTYINTPTTVKVNSGVGLGILFVSDVTE